MKKIVLIIVFLFVMHVPAFGLTGTYFENLDSLIKVSDNIVIAKMQKIPIQSSIGGLGEYKVIFVHNIKGDLPLNVPSTIYAISHGKPYHNLRSEPAILFLSEIRLGNNSYPYADSIDSILPVNPRLNYEELKNLPLKEQIIFILKDYIQYKKRSLFTMPKTKNKIQKDLMEIIAGDEGEGF